MTAPAAGKQAPAAGEALAEPVWVGRLQTAADALVAGFAAWTLLAWCFAFLGGSFRGLAWLLPLPLAVGLAFALRPAPPPAPPPEEGVVPRRAAAMGSLAAAVAGGFAWSGSLWIYWLFGSALLGWAWLRSAPEARSGTAPDPASPRPSGGLLLALCAAGVAVTLFAHRPDADDSFYLSLASTCLDRPDEAFLSRDGMFGEPDLPLYRPWYRLKTYEPLLAAIAFQTGAGVKDLYYLGLPALFGALAVLAHWSALRQIGAGHPGVGTAVALLVFLAWGDEHRTLGNFSFVRLFQGKAILVAVCVPAAVAYGWRYLSQPSARNRFLLGAVILASIGISGSAVVAVPPALAAVLAGSWRRGARGRIGRGLVPVGAALAGAAMVFVELGWHRSLLPSLDRLGELPERSAEALAVSLGSPARGAIALGALLAAPALVPRANRRRALGFAFVLVAGLLCPLLAGYVEEVEFRLGWRLFWAVPFPLLVGLLAQRLAGLAVAGRGRRAIPLLAAALPALAFCLLPGGSTLSPANRTELGWPRWKVPETHAVAAALRDVSRPDQRVLAPWPVAAWLPTFRGHPRPVGVRPHYWAPILATDPDSVAGRRELMRSVSSRLEGDGRRFVELLSRFEVEVVAFRGGRRSGARLAAVLRGAGYGRIQVMNGYEIWRLGAVPTSPVP